MLVNQMSAFSPKFKFMLDNFNNFIISSHDPHLLTIRKKNKLTCFCQSLQGQEGRIERWALWIWGFWCHWWTEQQHLRLPGDSSLWGLPHNVLLNGRPAERHKHNQTVLQSLPFYYLYLFMISIFFLSLFFFFNFDIFGHINLMKFALFRLTLSRSGTTSAI